jgi:hypothetical protein
MVVGNFAVEANFLGNSKGEDSFLEEVDSFLEKVDSFLEEVDSFLMEVDSFLEEVVEVVSFQGEDNSY